MGASLTWRKFSTIPRDLVTKVTVNREVKIRRLHFIIFWYRIRLWLQIQVENYVNQQQITYSEMSLSMCNMIWLKKNSLECSRYTAQKMKYSIKDFFSKCDQIRRKLQIWSQLLKKSLMKNFIFCVVISMMEWQ